MANERNRYIQIIERIFLKYYVEGASEVPFQRSDIVEVASQLGIQLPKNLGDLIYSFRYRVGLPDSITGKAQPGFEWIIRPAGRSRYQFVLTQNATFAPNPMLVKIKIPDATPGIVSRYSLDDEQALLAKVRYNRLLDIFTGVACYSLQNHLRTTLKEMGQVETDEVYAGIDRQGVHYVFTVQAKSKTDKVGVVQIEQDFAVCAQKFPNAVGRPVAAQVMDDETIALFEFLQTEEGIRVAAEKHYRLVSLNDLSAEEIDDYRRRALKE